MKRFLSLILVLTMILLCVAGCAPQEDKAPTTTAATTTAPVTTASEEQTVPTTTAPTDTQPQSSYGEASYRAELHSDSNVLNVLLIGTDGNSNYGRSDTMMLISLNKNSGTVKLLSFLRDTYVTIPGYTATKLNAAFAYGGADFAIETLEYNFGIDINGYAIVNFSTFKSIINSMGGIDVELTQDEIDYINAQIAQNNQSQYLPEGTTAGVVHLNGQQALWNARNRGGEVNGIYFYGSDWDRVSRQQRMLVSIVNDMKTASPAEISDIAYTALSYISTNLSGGDIATLIANAPTYLNYGFQRNSAPTGDTWEYDYIEHAGSVILIKDWETLRKDLAQYIYG